MKKILLVVVFFVVLSCGRTKEEYLEYRQKVSYTSPNYSIDTLTGLCFANNGAHGFTCVPCDSLRRLNK